MSEADLKKLEQFISDVRSDINLIVKKFAVLVPEHAELYKLISETWKEEVSQRFDGMMEYLEKEKPFKELMERGLTGKQLEVELAIYRLRRKEFEETLKDFEKEPEGVKKNMKRVLLRRLAERLLNTIQSILRSLGFIPGFDAIEQFKEAIKNAVSIELIFGVSPTN